MWSMQEKKGCISIKIIFHHREVQSIVLCVWNTCVCICVYITYTSKHMCVHVIHIQTYVFYICIKCTYIYMCVYIKCVYIYIPLKGVYKIRHKCNSYSTEHEINSNFLSLWQRKYLVLLPIYSTGFLWFLGSFKNNSKCLREEFHALLQGLTSH